MFKRIAASTVALTLGVALSLVGATSAQAIIDDGGGGGGAPTPSAADSINCATASVSLTDYDPSTTATVILDGVTEKSGTFGGSYSHSWSLTSDASHVSHRLQVTVVAPGGIGNVTYDQTATGCYTAPPVDPGQPTPPAVTYETVVWSMPSPNTGTSPTYPQVGVSQYKGETTQTLDVAVPSTCGTQYQVDVYLQTNGTVDNTAAIDAMFAAGLAGPNGAQDGIYLAGQHGNPGTSGLNHAWKFVKNAACPPPTVQPCTALGNIVTTGTAAGGLPSPWNTSDTRATGHNVVTGNALHVYTEGSTSTDKAAAYYPVNIPLADIGTPSISFSASTGTHPGFQIVLSDGRILVGEPDYYGDRFWSKTAQLGVPAADGYPASADLNTWLSALPSAQVVAIGYSLGSGVLGDSTITSLSLGAGCTLTFHDYVVPAVACVVDAGTPWAAEPGDLAPTVTSAGLAFAGPHSAAMDDYQRVTAGNMQGLTGMSVTYAPGGSGYQALVVVEVDPNVDLDATPGINHYATISSVLGANDTSGTFAVQDGLWYTSKIAYASPGGQGDPISWAAMTALMPNNTLLSAPSLHQQTQTGSDAISVVTNLSSSCGSTNFVPPLIDVAVLGDPTNTDQTCSASGLLGGVITVVATPHLSYEITDSANAVVPFDGQGSTDPLAPGDYTVTVTADPGYHLTSPPTYALTIAAFDGPCSQLPDHAFVIPSVVAVQMGCSTSGSYTLTNDQGSQAVTWTVNGSSVAQGTYTVSAAGHYVIDAAPVAPAYGVDPSTQTHWVLDFATPTTCSLNTLALTGSNPGGAFVLAGFLLLFGLVLLQRASRTRAAARS